MIRVMFLWWVCISVPAMAGGGATGGATEFTQILNNLQLTASYAESAQQTVTQLNQYTTMLTNLKRLAPSGTLDAAAQKLWKDQRMTQVFKNLYSVVVNGQRVSYGLQSADDQFTRMHPGYGKYKNFDFQKGYKDWSDTTRNSVEGALRMSAAQSDDFDSEQELVMELSDRSQTAEGQLQALQAGNQVGIAMVGQMQKLRQLQMAQAQAQNSKELAEQGRKDASDDLMRQFLNPKVESRNLKERSKDGKLY